MGIKGDVVTHTSDNFQFLYDSCITMLKTGKAYADDTEQTKVDYIYRPSDCYPSHSSCSHRCKSNAWTASPPNDETRPSRRTSRDSLR